MSVDASKTTEGTGPERGPTGGAPRGVLVALCALLFAGLAVRLTGVEFCLPHMRENDHEIVTQVEHLRGKPLKTKSSRVFYATYPLLTAVATWAATSPEPELGSGATLAQHLEKAGDDFADTRRTVAVLSSLLVPVTWLLARRFAGPRWALFAAALTASSVLHVFFSQEARPHGPAAVCFVLAMLALFRLRRTPSTASYALAGLVLALLIGFLQSGIAMGIPLLVAHVLRRERRLFDPRLLLVGLIVAASIPGSYWPLFDRSLRDVESTLDEEVVAMPGHVVHWSRFNGGGLEITLQTLRSYEPALSVLVLAALAIFAWTRFSPRTETAPEEARERRAEAWIALAFVLPYGSMISLWEENYERFVIPLLPFLATFSAWSARELTARLRGAPRVLAAGAFLVCLALPGYASARLAWLRHVPDTAERAAQWIEQHLDPARDEIFAMPWWDLPLVRSEESLQDRRGGKAFHVISTWKTYQASLDPGELPPPYWSITSLVVINKYDGQTREGLSAYLDSFGPGYYVIDAKKRGHPWMRWMSDELGRRGELLARISPDRDEWAWNYPLFDQDGVEADWPDMTPRILGARCVGPVIEIYRVD
jgi:hypothetical protein